MRFEIVPHVGIGPVRLGMTTEEVREAMRPFGGLRGSSGPMDYFLDNGFQVEYEGGSASFIGVSHNDEHSYAFRDADPFDMPAEALFAFIAKREQAAHAFEPYMYVFPDQIVAVWDADEQYDYAGGHLRSVYAQVGIGDARYLAGMCSLGKTE